MTPEMVGDRVEAEVCQGVGLKGNPADPTGGGSNHNLFLVDRAGSRALRACFQGMPVLLTKAIFLLSGDQEGTFIVPWPP